MPCRRLVQSSPSQHSPSASPVMDIRPVEETATPTAPAKRRRTSTIPTPIALEDGEVTPTTPARPAPEVIVLSDDDDDDGDETDSAEEGEVTAASERAAIDNHVDISLSAGANTPTVAQKDARYYMLSAVVCSHCGVKGHLSFHCTEETENERCFLCGASGHSSRSCPKEVCFVCGSRGHRARDCSSRPGVERRRFVRDIPLARDPVLTCYVCGGHGHLDCSLTRADSAGILSCYNCGEKGHAGHGCQLANADKVMGIVRGMDIDRKRAGGRSKRKSREEDSAEFRYTLVQRARQKRYGR